MVFYPIDHFILREKNRQQPPDKPQNQPGKSNDKQKSNQPTGHRNHCQPPGSRIVGVGARFDSQSKRRL
jgi:hypothetical protein